MTFSYYFARNLSQLWKNPMTPMWSNLISRYKSVSVFQNLLQWLLNLVMLKIYFPSNSSCLWEMIVRNTRGLGNFDDMSCPSAFVGVEALNAKVWNHDLREIPSLYNQIKTIQCFSEGEITTLSHGRQMFSYRGNLKQTASPIIPWLLQIFIVVFLPSPKRNLNKNKRLLWHEENQRIDSTSNS